MQDTKYFVDTDTNVCIELQTVVCAIYLTKSICVQLVYIDFFARKKCSTINVICIIPHILP